MRADLIVDGDPQLPHDPEREFVIASAATSGPGVDAERFERRRKRSC